MLANSDATRGKYITKTRETAAMRLGTQLRSVEDCIDETGRTMALLYAEIAQTAAEFRDDPATSQAQPALMRLQKALADITSARGEIARVHGTLLDAYKITMTPAEDECPDWVVQPIAHVPALATEDGEGPDGVTQPGMTAEKHAA